MKKIIIYISLLFIVLVNQAVVAMDIRNYDSLKLNKILKKHIGKCEHSLFIHQNLRAPKKDEKNIRNGYYDRYTGEKVREVHILQKNLKRFDLYKGKIDGIIGPKTAKAIKEFQSFYGLEADGYVGPITRLIFANSCGPTVEDILNEYYGSITLERNHDFKTEDEDIELSKKVFLKKDDLGKSKSSEIKISGKSKKDSEDTDFNIDLSFKYNLNDPEISFESNWEINDKIKKGIIGIYSNDLLKDAINIFPNKNSVKGIFKNYNGYIRVDKIPRRINGLVAESFSEAGLKLNTKELNGKWISYGVSEEDKKVIKVFWKVFYSNYKNELEQDYGLYQKYPFLILDKDSGVNEVLGEIKYDAKIDLNMLRSYLLKSKKYKYFNKFINSFSDLVLQNGFLNNKIMEYIKNKLPQEDLGNIMFIRPFLDLVKIKVVVKDDRIFKINGSIFLEGERNVSKHKIKFGDIYINMKFEIKNNYFNDDKSILISSPDKYIDIKKRLILIYEKINR